MSFCGKNALITAGARGIGRAIAERFSQAGAGIHIVDADAKAAGEFGAAHPDALVSVADASQEGQVRQTLAAHAGKLGGVDVMVNCAGIAGPTALLEDISLEEWHRCIAVNLDSAFLYCRSVIPMMKAAGSGNIINISSTAGWHGYPLRTPYASAKWAVLGLTKSLAMELGPAGIRVNAICPGSISGERMDRVIAREAKQKGMPEDRIRAHYRNSCSLRTFIDAEDIADMALFLASPRASRVSGQVINVDGHLENPGSMED